MVDNASKSTTFAIFPLLRIDRYPNRYAKHMPVSAVKTAISNELNIYAVKPTPWVLEKILAICSMVNVKSLGKALVKEREINASCGRNKTKHKPTITAMVATLKLLSAAISFCCFSVTLWSLNSKSKMKEITEGTSSTNPAIEPLPYWKEDMNWL